MNATLGAFAMKFKKKKQRQTYYSRHGQNIMAHNEKFSYFLTSLISPLGFSNLAW